MTDRPVDLDRYRGLAAQKSTEARRLLAEVQANEKALRERRDELEAHLLAAPASSWSEAAEKAHYLLSLFAETPQGQDPRRQALIAAVLEDFLQLSGADGDQLPGEDGALRTAGDGREMPVEPPLEHPSSRRRVQNTDEAFAGAGACRACSSLQASCGVSLADTGEQKPWIGSGASDR